MMMDPAQRRLLPKRRMFMLSSLLFSVGYSYAINEGFGIPLLLEAGLNERYAPIVFGISSIASIFVAEYIGSASDRCASLLGRRRPYIIGLTAVVLLVAMMYPHGSTLSNLFHLKGNSHSAYLITHTAICVIVFDVFLDMMNSTDRSYLVDSIRNEQSDIGNSIFSALVSGGSFMGAFISSLDWEGWLNLSTGSQAKVVFATVVVVLFVCLSLTLCSVKEPHVVAKSGELHYASTSNWMKIYICCNYFAFKLYKHDSSHIVGEFELQDMENSSEVLLNNAELIAEDSIEDLNCNAELIAEDSIQDLNCRIENGSENNRKQSSESNIEVIGCDPTSEMEEEVQSLSEISSDDLTSKSSQKPIALLDSNDNQQQSNSYKCTVNCVPDMLNKLHVRILSAVNFITSLSAATALLWITHLLEWMAMLSINFFITNYVGSVVYGGSAVGEPGSDSLRDYNKGVRIGFACQSIEFASSFVFSLSFKRLITVIRLREISVIVHVLTFVSTGSLIAFNSIYLVAFVHVIFGWYFALIQIIPFTIIQQYKEDRVLFRKEFPDVFDADGKAVAFLYTSLFFAQVVVSFSTGSLIKAYGSAAAPMITATIASFLASLVLCFLPIKQTSNGVCKQRCKIF